MMTIKKVTVIGANGTVGSQVAGIFASFGGAQVYLISKEKSEQAVLKASLSVKAISIESRLIPKTYDDLKNCIEDSDLIFESVSENLSLKKEIHSQIAKFVKKDCLISTGTSGLSIDELACCYEESLRENFFGIHFFNPPYSLTLCELIPCNYVKQDTIKNMKSYLENQLIRDVIIVKNTPAFLANRIGFKFMNEALQYALKYKDKGGIDYIDAILGCYTGRNMPPILTVNFVGLDVHKAIVDNLFSSVYEEGFVLPEYVNDLIMDGKIGLKAGVGLYKICDDKILVYDIQSKQYREKIEYKFDFKEKAIAEFKKAHYFEGFKCIIEDESIESKICMSFLLNYVIYSVNLAKEISENILDCDVAMVYGFNWIPPISLIELMGGPKKFILLCHKYLGEGNYDDILNLKKSNIDYRSYIKAKN